VPQVIPRKSELAGRHALIVDDNATNREILIRQLAAWRVESAAVPGGEEAVAALRAAVAAGAPFHFAILDLQMPAMTGLQLAKTVHTDPALVGLRMIILTSMGQSPTRRELDAAGVGACIFKPARQSQLHDTLLTLMSGSAAGVTPPVRPELPPPAAEPPDVKLRILVAEDNLVNQQVARMQLEKFGYHPDLVANGEQAVATVRARAYDVVIMDCQMPGLDGFAATREIRAWEAGRRARGESFVPLHIIAMTANAMVGDREECLAAGMDDYVSKPVRADDLAAALARTPVGLG
jgi:CheY-like chemotaxis protein